MKPNRNDIQFAVRSASLSGRSKEIRQLGWQRFAFYGIAGMQLGLLAYDFLHPLLVGEALRKPNPFVGIFAMLMIAFALHADAKLKIILAIQENQK